jgi:hypothetical protein
MADSRDSFNAPSGLNADTILLTDGSVLIHDATAASAGRLGDPAGALNF